MKYISTKLIKLFFKKYSKLKHKNMEKFKHKRPTKQRNKRHFTLKVEDYVLQKSSLLGLR